MKHLLWIESLVGGAVVLGTYAHGIVTHAQPADALWGHVPLAVRGLYSLWMLVAAAGYIAVFLHLTARLELPGWRGPLPRALPWIYLAVLLPSAAWMPLTFHHAAAPSALRWAAVRVVLSLVAAGAFALILVVARGAPVAGRGSRRVALAGAIAFAIQTVLLDALAWPALY